MDSCPERDSAAERCPYRDPAGWGWSRGCSPGCEGSWCASRLAWWRPTAWLEGSGRSCRGRAACPGSWSGCRLPGERSVWLGASGVTLEGGGGVVQPLGACWVRSLNTSCVNRPTRCSNVTSYKVFISVWSVNSCHGFGGFGICELILFSQQGSWRQTEKNSLNKQIQKQLARRVDTLTVTTGGAHNGEHEGRKDYTTHTSCGKAIRRDVSVVSGGGRCCCTLWNKVKGQRNRGGVLTHGEASRL